MWTWPFIAAILVIVVLGLGAIAFWIDRDNESKAEREYPSVWLEITETEDTP